MVLLIRVCLNVMLPYNPTPQEEVQNEHQPNGQEQPDEPDLDEQELKDWTKGWNDTVYNEDCENPDITLGEMLLLYFEWMSVHKVSFNVCPQ